MSYGYNIPLQSGHLLYNRNYVFKFLSLSKLIKNRLTTVFLNGYDVVLTYNTKHYLIISNPYISISCN